MITLHNIEAISGRVFIFARAARQRSRTYAVRARVRMYVHMSRIRQFKSA